MNLATYLLTVGLTFGAASPAAKSGRAPDLPAVTSVSAVAPADAEAPQAVAPPRAASLPPVTASTPAPEERPADRRRSVVSFRWENDVVGGTDDNYTDGVSLSLSREGRGPLGGIWHWFGPVNGRLVASYELGQIMMTPRDIRRPVPDPTDRPYAGLLYVAFSTEYVHGNQLDGLKFISGVVGPASLAEQTQKAFHKISGSPDPQGWAYQLKNEPILNLVYEHRRRYSILESRSGWGAEAIPVVGAMLGNVLIQAEADAQFRFGYNLPRDFGTTLMRGMGNLPFPRTGKDAAAAHQFGAYVFAGGGGNLVARNLTLDGNTFRAGPRVPKEPAFGAAEAGASVWSRWLEVTFTYVYWGREFRNQGKPSRFGAAIISVHF
jgi:lipid A 3-O-deacylase